MYQQLCVNLHFSGPNYPVVVGNGIRCLFVNEVNTLVTASCW